MNFLIIFFAFLFSTNSPEYKPGNGEKIVADSLDQIIVPGDSLPDINSLIDSTITVKVNHHNDYSSRYYLKIIKPDSSIDYKILEIKPDPHTDYKIIITDPKE
jgi:hypothetical protein